MVRRLPFGPERVCKHCALDDACQVCGADLAPRGGLADIGVLAIHTAQVAAGKEDRSRASPAAEGALLPRMGTKTAHPGKFTGLTHPQLTPGAVDTAAQRANVTTFQARVGSVHPTA